MGPDSGPQIGIIKKYEFAKWHLRADLRTGADRHIFLSAVPEELSTLLTRGWAKPGPSGFSWDSLIDTTGRYERERQKGKKIPS